MVLDATDVSALHWLLEGIVTFMATVLWWIWGRLVKRVDDVEDATQKLKLEQKDSAMAVTDLRLHVSENYASKPETSASIARVHEKIEKLNDDVVRHIETLRKDIREDIRDAMNGVRKE